MKFSDFPLLPCRLARLCAKTFTKVILCLGIISVVSGSARADMLVQPNDSIAFCGDSITEQRIYTCFVEDYLLMCQPTAGHMMTQMGWGGEQAAGLLARLDSDFYPFKPTFATTCYGMNDGHYVAITPEIADTYLKDQTAIIDSLKQHGVRTIIIGSPKCVDTVTYLRQKTDGVTYNKTLSALADIDRDIAKKENIPYADVYEQTFAAMKKAKKTYGENYVFGGNDGVHPGPNGQLVMAYAFLRAMGCNGAIATLTVDLGSHQAQVTPGQKIVSFENNDLEVESTRYPFCFKNGPADPLAAAPMRKIIPFDQDLNRYLLVVTGLTSAKAKVTWGTESKTFSKSQLAAGINLAAEFPANPFVEAFEKVDAAVHNQQDNQLTMIKNFLHWRSLLEQISPNQSAAIASMIQDALHRSDTLFQAAASAVVPVRHKLLIDPAL
jgi:lysophospholipase L1-like esterase